MFFITTVRLKYFLYAGHYISLSPYGTFVTKGLLFVTTDISSLTGLPHRGKILVECMLLFTSSSPVGTKYFYPDNNGFLYKMLF